MTGTKTNSPESVRDQVVIVTGASDGIGRATAEILSAAGAHVVICARRNDRLKTAAESLRAAGGNVEEHVLDVGNLDDFAALIGDVARRHGRLDGMVNNAAALTYKSVLELTVEDWRKDFSINAEAVFVGTREAMRVMIPRGRGSIINISSTCGIRATPGLSSYSASKAALMHFSACAAIEAAAHGVRVNSIVPGQIATPAAKALNDTFADKGAAVAKAIPMQRSGLPEEIGLVVKFLLSDASAYITGAALPIDGGKAMQLYVPD